MFEVLGREPQCKVETLDRWDAKTRRLRRTGAVYPTMRNVAFYLEAAQVLVDRRPHRPPVRHGHAAGLLPQLRDREFPTGSFRDRMKAGTAAMPTDV